MNITDAQYVNLDLDSSSNSVVRATVDGQLLFVAIDPDNTHYAEILRQVDAGTITIEDAD